MFGERLGYAISLSLGVSSTPALETSSSVMPPDFWERCFWLWGLLLWLSVGSTGKLGAVSWVKLLSVNNSVFFTPSIYTALTFGRSPVSPLLR